MTMTHILSKLSYVLWNQIHYVRVYYRHVNQLRSLGTNKLHSI